MSITPIDAIDGSSSNSRYVQMNTAELARQLVAAQRASMLTADTTNNANNTNSTTNNNTADTTTNTTSGANSPVTAGSAGFSPAIYAQASEYQLYSQAGTPVALLMQQGLGHPVTPTPSYDSETNVKAVEGSSSGGGVDTLA